MSLTQRSLVEACRDTLLDLHAHFPMRLGLAHLPSERGPGRWGRDVLFAVAKRFLNDQLTQGSRITPEAIHKGGVGGLGSVLYDPQDEFFVGVEPRPIAFDHIRQQFAMVEAEADKHKIAIARNPVEIEQLLHAGTPFLFHCMEGGRGLGGEWKSVKELADKGVFYITVAHLLYRGVATCVNAFPQEWLFRRLNREQPSQED